MDDKLLYNILKPSITFYINYFSQNALTAVIHLDREDMNFHEKDLAGRTQFYLDLSMKTHIELTFIVFFLNFVIVLIYMYVMF